MSPHAAISRTVMKSRIPKLVNRRGDDDANSKRHRAEQNRQRGVVFLHDLFPQVVWGYFVDDDERPGKDHDADSRVDDGVGHIGRLEDHLVASCVEVVTGIYGTVRTGIVAYGTRDILDFID